MIPTKWIEERTALLLQQYRQSEQGYVYAADELPIGDEDFELLAATPVTEAELAALAQDARGQYRLGDTRGFVERQEHTCVQCNCWMQRAVDGAVSYFSQTHDEVVTLTAIAEAAAAAQAAPGT